MEVMVQMILHTEFMSLCGTVTLMKSERSYPGLPLEYITFTPWRKTLADSCLCFNPEGENPSSWKWHILTDYGDCQPPCMDGQ